MFKREKKLLGEILLEAGLINQKQLFIALERQKATGDRLGKVLIDNKFITEEKILDVIEKQMGIPKINLFKEALSPAVVRIIPESLARRHKVIAVKIKDGRIVLAVSDPLNIYAIDDIKMAAGKEIDPVIAPEADIERAINRYYGLDESMSKAFKEMPVDNRSVAATTLPVNDLDSVSGDAPVVRIVNSIINQAIKMRASDIHIEPLEKRLRVRFRIDGVLQEVMNPPTNAQAAIISRIKIMANLDIAEHRLPQDGRIEVNMVGQETDLRISVLPTMFGEKVVIRILNKASFLYDMDNLNFQPDTKKLVERLITEPNGMILVTGPTGSGKTTTLYSVLSKLNRLETNIITVEDPVEYRIDGINQVQVNPKVGLTFANGLRSILRQDPNIIMVGEIRDSETAEIAIRAALTGHLVLSTLHTNDAAGALARLIDMGIEPFLVSSSVLGVTAQRLLRKICPSCKEEYSVTPDSAERQLLRIPNDQHLTLYRGKGCGQCNNTGYLGRTAIHEVMIINDEIKELINKRAPSHVIKEAAIKNGMITLFQDGIAKMLKGVTTFQELLRYSYAEDYK